MQLNTSVEFGQKQFPAGTKPATGMVITFKQAGADSTLLTFEVVFRPSAHLNVGQLVPADYEVTIQAVDEDKKNVGAPVGFTISNPGQLVTLMVPISANGDFSDNIENPAPIDPIPTHAG